MKTNRSLRAFSLIELSIVVLIIGILIAGVTQSTRILSQARLNTARTLTQSSPVSSIKNLSLWIDSTSEESFASSEAEDGQEVTTWYDLNPQATTKSNFTGSTGATGLYTDNVINSLPAVLFGGTDEFMASSEFPNINSQATVFLVIQTPSTLESDAILGKRVAASDTGTNLQLGITSSGFFSYCDSNPSSSNASHCWTTEDNAASTSANVVVAATYISDTAADNSIRVFVNSLSSASIDDAGSNGSQTSGFNPVTTSTNLFLGKSGLTADTAFFNGYVGEVIIYDRKLKEEEILSVITYLGKKWNITIAE